MRNPGVEYVCYFPTGGSKTITLSAATYNQSGGTPERAASTTSAASPTAAEARF